MPSPKQLLSEPLLTLLNLSNKSAALANFIKHIAQLLLSCNSRGWSGFVFSGREVTQAYAKQRLACGFDFAVRDVFEEIKLRCSAAPDTVISAKCTV